MSQSFIPWNFDHAVEYQRKLRSQESEAYNIILGNLRSAKAKKSALEKKVEELQHPGDLLPRENVSQYQVAVMNAESNIEGIMDLVLQTRRASAGHTIKKQLLEQSRPVVLGPSTLHSLFDHTPKSFDYIRNGQLPLDNMFFEVVDPFDIDLPFVNDSGQVIGVHLYKTENFVDLFYKQITGPSDPLNVFLDTRAQAPEELRDMVDEQPEQMGYTIQMYYRDQNGEIGSLNTILNPSTMDLVAGYLEPPKKGSINFWMNLRDRRMTTRSVDQGLDSGYSDFVPIDNGEDSTIHYMANLVTNIVNFINARNNQFVERSEDVERVVRNKRGKKRKSVEPRRFYIVLTNPEPTQRRYDSNGTGEKLTERLFSMGHNRTYRHDSGDVRYTTWVSPCVKGPEDAPWRNQRHMIFGEQLLTERKMMKRYA